MVSIALPKRLALPRFKAKPRVKRPYRETVWLFDCTDHKVKRYTMPFEVLVKNFPTNCRYVTDLFWFHVGGAVAYPLIGGFLIGLALWFLFVPFFAVMLTILLVMPLPFIGWFTGHKLMLAGSPLLRPFWMLYRMETIDDDTGEIHPTLAPILHTQGRGVPPQLYDIIQDEFLADLRKDAEDAGIDEIPEYRPWVNQASDLHQNLDGNLEREENRIHNSMRENIQLGGLLTMTAASLAILFVIGMATSGGG